MAYDYGDFVSGRLVNQLGTSTTTGVTVQMNKINGAYVSMPTGAMKLMLVRETESAKYAEKILVAAGTTNNAATGVATLGTITRNVSLSDGSDVTGSAATITWVAGTKVYLCVDTHDMEQSVKKNETNTLTGIGAIRSSSTTTAAIRPNSVTTTQRDAITAANGDVVYNSTTGQLNQYVSGAWTAIGDTGTPTATETAEGKVELATIAEHDPATTGAKVIQAKNCANNTTDAAENKVVTFNNSSKVDPTLLGTGTPTVDTALLGDGTWGAVLKTAPAKDTEVLYTHGSFSSTTNTTTTVLTATIPANYLEDEDVIIIEYAGYIDGTGNVILKWGATTIIDLAVVSTAFTYKAIIGFSPVGASGQVRGVASVSGDTSAANITPTTAGDPETEPSPVSVDTTSEAILKVDAVTDASIESQTFYAGHITLYRKNT